MKKYWKAYWPLIVSFILPFIIMLIYFIYRNMSPFGHSSVLTVDLGQQYIDFFAYLKRTLLNHPEGLTYSFSNALGSNMIGSIAYYLMSPINLLILLFPIKYMTTGILMIILIKYGLSGLSMSYLLFHTDNINFRWIPLWSTIYALNGWIIANQLNIMWLDGMILLPVIVLGINRIINDKKSTTYIGGLTLILIINYYIGYMISIFVVLYIIYNIYIHFNSFQWLKKKILIFIKSTLISGLLSSWILLPTWYSITQGKGQYTNKNIKWNLEYNPFHLISKFINGSFNFNQMPQGTPNLFVGSITIILFLLYFFNHNISLKNRIATIILSLILLFSMFISPLDIFWHAMQPPSWYPYRFSFIFCFWMIWIAIISINHYPVNKKLNTFIFPILIIAIGIIYISLNHKAFDFIKNNNLITGIIFMIVTLLWVFNLDKKIKGSILILTLIVISEMSLNVFNSLNNISYVSNDNYVKYTKMLQKPVNNIQHHDSSFYRIAKTFYRTKNDPLEVGYNSGDNFSSTLEKKTTNFMDEIGQPDGEGFVEYGNGTMFTDSLLTMKYMLGQNTNNKSLPLNALAQRPDINNYQSINIKNDITTYKNKWALPLIFSGGNQTFNDNYENDPIQYQNNIFSSLTNHKYSNLFSPENFDSTTFDNVNNSNTITGAIFKRRNSMKSADINLKVIPKTNDSYYLTVGNNINPNNSKIYINNKLVTQYPTYRNTIILNIAANNKNKPINIKVNLSKNDLWMQNFTLYHFNNQIFEDGISELKNNDYKSDINYNVKNNFKGNVVIKPNQSLLTTIPYDRGWHLKVNGQTYPITQWNNMFIGAKLKPGKYYIILSYHPPLLNVGIIITIMTIIGLLVKKYFKRKNNY